MKIPRLTLASIAILCFTVAAYAGKKTEPTSAINLTIVRDANGKPVKNAEVVLHMVQKGKEKQEGLELKTHEDGKAEASGLPYGTWRIQVIAPGYRTYGQDFELNQPTHEFTIKLQKPADQVSIYKQLRQSYRLDTRVYRWRDKRGFYEVHRLRDEVCLDRTAWECHFQQLYYLHDPERAGKHLLRVRVFFHGKCFDGTASAALFSRFYRERIRSDVDFEFTGLVHRAGALFNEADFDGDENAIVDFKYSASPKITWWFDHHESAFLSPQDAEHYRNGDKSKKFFDPEFKSCTKFLAEVAENKFGFNPHPVAELIQWADIIDGAQFKSPQEAVEMAEPAMKLTMAIESTNDSSFLPRLIPYLVSEPLSRVLEEPFVAAVIPPLMERHRKSIEILRKRSECRQGTIYFDISDHDLEGYNKFIPYYLHPESVYSVGLSSSSFRVKVSVGSNPWTNRENMVNLAKVCERYGGGGHARVGAISFPPDKGDLAREAAAEIVAELRAAESRAI